MRRVMTGLALALIALPAWAQSIPDRSRLPLQEALAGHWYVKKYDKHEYFEVVSHDPSPGENKKSYGPVMMTWDTRGGKEASQGAIVSFFQAVDEKQNMLILTYKSANGKFVYSNRYTFTPDRNTITKQGLAVSRWGRPLYEPNKLVYVDATSRSQYVPR
jgi:hypothetical protein